MSNLAIAITLGAAADDSARYFSTTDINTTAADTPASTHFETRISKDATVEFKRSIGCVFWGSQSSEASIGSIDLANGDGGLDVLRTVTTRNRSVTIQRGEIGTNVSTWPVVATAIVDRVEFPDESRCRLILRDKAALLDKPIQDDVYISSGNPTLDNQPKPIVIGVAINVPCVFENPSTLEYDIHDTGSPTVLRVRDTGDEMTLNTHYTVSGYTITFLQQPIGVITADINQGDYLFDDFVEELLVTRLGLSTSEVPNANLAPIDTAFGNWYGRWIYSGETYAQVMDEVVVSFAGWWYFDRLGVLQVGYLTAPTGTSTHTFNSVNVSPAEISVELDRAPGLSNTVLGRRNWRVHNENEIALSLTDPTYTQIAYDLQQNYRHRKIGTGTLHSTYAHALGPQSPTGALGALRPGVPAVVGLGSLIVTNDSGVDVQAEATRRVGLYTQQRWFVTFTGFFDDAYTVEPGDVVTLQVDRYGMDSGTKMMVVSVEGDFLSDEITIKGWF